MRHGSAVRNLLQKRMSIKGQLSDWMKVKPCKRGAHGWSRSIWHNRSLQETKAVNRIKQDSEHFQYCWFVMEYKWQDLPGIQHRLYPSMYQVSISRSNDLQVLPVVLHGTPPQEAGLRAVLKQDQELVLLHFHPTMVVSLQLPKLVARLAGALQERLWRRL